MKDIDYVIAVLRLYKKKYRKLSNNLILVEDKLCRKFFKVLNDRIEGMDFWYELSPGLFSAIMIKTFKGEQL